MMSCIVRTSGEWHRLKAFVVLDSVSLPSRSESTILGWTSYIAWSARSRDLDARTTVGACALQLETRGLGSVLPQRPNYLRAELARSGRHGRGLGSELPPLSRGVKAQSRKAPGGELLRLRQASANNAAGRRHEKGLAATAINARRYCWVVAFGGPEMADLTPRHSAARQPLVIGYMVVRAGGLRKRPNPTWSKAPRSFVGGNPSAWESSTVTSSADPPREPSPWVIG